MPELPEVETIKNDLKKKILNKKIIAVLVKNKKTLKNNEVDFKKILEGGYFSSLSRTGKLLIFGISDQKSFLLIHLKMTGQLIFREKNKIIAGGHGDFHYKDSEFFKTIASSPCKHTRVIFQFEDKADLFFNDLRKFGYLKIVNAEELKRIKGEYGIEPLAENFTYQNFKKTLQAKKAPVKAILLNQKLIAGIGNIYADEALFSAKIRPDRPAGSLNDREIKALFDSAKQVIKKAIKLRGTTFNSYMDASGRKGGFSRLLKAYGREGKKCRRCPGGEIRKIKVAGRGTRICEICQK